MKCVFILILALTASLTTLCQTYMQNGDRCFDNGDYACAIRNYKNAFNHATGKDKQIAEIKLIRARWCVEHIKKGDTAFTQGNYSQAREEYQKVLDTNPKDQYAKSQILKCTEALIPKLRKATDADLIDIWNNKYGVNPQRRQNLINAGIDPDDAQARINAGEGKPQDIEEQATYLTVTKSTLHFRANGKSSEKIIVNSDVTSYSIPLDYITYWYTVKTYRDYFIVTASVNPNNISRQDWFKVKAGGKEVIINIEQSAKNECFNCPKTNDTWGLRLGYVERKIDNYSMTAIQLGLKAEPLFRYGFGLNTGINLLGYSKKMFDFDFEAYAVNIPLHLEYRLNFSKWFNIFSYGGVGFNAVTNPSFDNYSLPATLEYGGGFRINRIQFNAGKSLYLGNLKNTQNFGKEIETYQQLIISISYMF